MTRRVVADIDLLRSLPDGTVAQDRFGAVWVVEAWASFATGSLVRERWWYTTGDKKSYSDEEVATMGPMTVIRGAQRSA